ncbi:MAG TPA: LuxR C-terminal-related transcriptional regulator [Gaiellaceae bacterium]|nr:LuxR C-terminal-related transcriptional regulator [Gaiellaceae bacterium]
MLGARDHDGNLVCHAGCSNARIAREGWPVRCHDVIVGRRDASRAFSLSTITVQRPGGREFLHVLTARETRRDRGRSARLTPRQYEMLELLARGVTVKAAAAQLGIRETTARNHVRARRARRAFAARSRRRRPAPRPSRLINFRHAAAPPG